MPRTHCSASCGCKNASSDNATNEGIDHTPERCRQTAKCHGKDTRGHFQRKTLLSCLALAKMQEVDENASIFDKE
jgi:hypothetical protein